MRRAACALALLALALAAAGCAALGRGTAGFESDGERLKVATTTNFITDSVAAVGGSRVEVVGLMGPGVDPHLYRASAGDVETLADADLVFYGGLLLEAKLQEVLEEVGRKRPAIAVTRDIPERLLLAPPAGSPSGEEHDPHVWFDVALWMRAVETIRDGLIEADPDGEAAYRRNAARYLRRLRRLDRFAAAQLARVPARRRVLVTSHDAFRYLGRAYGVEVAAIQGISTADEATTADIERVAALIAGRGVRAVFVESSVPPQTIDAVLAAARERGARVRLGGELYSDAAGDPGTAAGTYVGMVEANVRRLVEGLL